MASKPFNTTGIGLCLVGIILAIHLARGAAAIHRQRVAIECIDRLAGSVTVAHTNSEFVRRMLGPGILAMLDRVIAVDLTDTECNDEDLRKLIITLTSVEELRLDDTRVTNDGLVGLQHLPALQYLGLNQA